MEDLHEEDYLQIEEDNLEYARASCWAGVMILGLCILAFAVKGVHCWYQGH